MAKLVSKVYGDALFEAGINANKLDEIYSEIKDLNEVFINNPEIKKLLEAPKIAKEEKIQAVKSIFSSRLSEETMGFLVIVIEKGRQNEFEAIFKYFLSQVKEYKKIGVATVVSAIDLSDERKKEIEQKLIDTTKYESFEINFLVNEEIIGGLIIRINDRVVDSSISTGLYELKKKLLA